MPTSNTNLEDHKSTWRSEIEHLTCQPLRMISVHLTDHCNSKCQFCVINSPLRQIPIPTEDLVEFVSSFAHENVDILNLHGGEPTLSEALFPVIEAARAININEIHMQTNGIALADREFVDRLIDSRVNVFVISLHGHTAKLQEQINLTPHSFDKIISGIENCLRAGSLVRTNTVVCRQNINYLYDVIALSYRLGVPWQNISALHPAEHAKTQFSKLVPHPKEIREVLPAVLHKINADLPDAFFELEGFATCHIPGFENHQVKKGLRDISLKYHGIVIDNYERFMDTSERTLMKDCTACRHIGSCNGIYKSCLLEFQSPLVWPETEIIGKRDAINCFMPTKSR